MAKFKISNRGSRAVLMGGLMVLLATTVGCIHLQDDPPELDCELIAEGVDSDEAFRFFLAEVVDPAGLLRVGDAVYNCPCIPGRSRGSAGDVERLYGGDWEGRRFGGDEDLERLYGGHWEGRRFGGDGDLERLYGGDWEGRRFGGDEDLARLYGGDSEGRRLGGDEDLERLYGGDLEGRRFGGDEDLARLYGGDEGLARLYRGASEERTHGGAGEDRLMGGDVSAMRCVAVASPLCSYEVRGVNASMSVVAGGEIRPVQGICIP